MENTKIEWCDSSWNPVTGCYNNCPYCYARRIANRLKGCDNCPSGIHPSLSRIIELSHRLQATSKDGKKRAAAYPFGFTPTLHEYRLDDPQKKGFGKTVFVCSMADMFGPWVPDEWIKRVFQSCLDAPGHRYLFLTKNPIRYIELAEAGILPERDDFWYGSTVTGPEVPAFYGGGYKTFASIEPILKPFDAPGSGGIADTIDWAIFGAETGNRKDKVVPERNWIEGAVKAFKDKGKPVFMKDSMKPVWGEELLTEFPWED